MLAESAPWTFCQNNTVMLTYTHNHALGILLWRCCCHGNEKQNSKSFFNYDANLTSVITMELKFIFFSLRCLFLCMTSLAASSMLKTSVKFWGTSFKFWLRPCYSRGLLSAFEIINHILYVLVHKIERWARQDKNTRLSDTCNLYLWRESLSMNLWHWILRVHFDGEIYVDIFRSSTTDYVIDYADYAV